MEKTHKRASKIVLLFIIIVLIGISAIIFGYGGESVQEIKNEAGQKANNVIEKQSEVVVEKVIESSKEKMGEKLKEAGEKLLEESESPGYYGDYGDEGVEEYENVVLSLQRSGVLAVWS